MRELVRSGRVEPALVVLTIVHVVLAVMAFARAGTTDDSDIERFREIAATEGTPWRDFEVEYAPGEAALLLTLPDTDPQVARIVTGLALAADLAIAVTLALVWGATRARTYLLVMLPLLTFVFYRLDLVVVALVVLGVVEVRRHPALGGSLFGVAVLTKIWPAVVVPLVARRRPSALFAAAVVVLLGSVAWLWWGGSGAIGQVVGFRGARGWSVESGVGSVVWLVTGGPVELEAGAPRTGSASLAWRLVLLAILVVGSIIMYRRARTWRGDPYGVPSLGMLGLLLVTAPLFSLQYASWLAPSVAVAWSEGEDRRSSLLGIAVIALTGIEFVTVQLARGALQTRLVVVTRNVCVLAMVVGVLVTMARASRAASTNPPVDWTIHQKGPTT